mgnify:CR=1 FL=1
MDEPTSSFTSKEVDILLNIIRSLKARGIGMIFISHKLDEIKRICDRATIMRSGKSMGTYNVNEISTSDMSKLMVGREVVLEFDKQPAKVKDVMLSVSHLDAYNAQGVQKVRDLPLNCMAARSSELQA